MICEFGKDSLQYFKANDIHPIIEEIVMRYSHMGEDECIQIYAPSDVADILCVELIGSIDDIEFRDETELELLDNDNDVVVVYIYGDASIEVTNIIDDDYNYCDYPSDYMNYICDHVPMWCVARIYDCDLPMMLFGITDDCCCCDESSVEIFEEDGKKYGFRRDDTDEYGNGYYAEVFCSDPIDDDTMNLLMDIL